jgi:predicted nucleic acid-binding Zn ribbon protein
MIDFFKAEIIGARVEDFLNHPLLDYKGTVVLNTSELEDDKYVAEYRTLKFIIRKGRRVEIQGSLHKYHTGKINYNDFTYQEIVEALHRLSSDFKIDLSSAHIHNLEYGVNVKLSKNPHTYIDNLIDHRGSSFQDMFGDAKKTGVQSVKQQFTIKVYNKGMQCGLGEYLLRFEVKVIKMQYLKKYGINFLSDLTDTQKLKSLRNDLEKVSREMLMSDPEIDWARCEESSKELLRMGRYPKFWKDLKRKNRKRHNYLKKKFRELTVQYGKGFQSQLINKIITKADYLLEHNSIDLVKLTKPEAQRTEYIRGKCLVKLTNSAVCQVRLINSLSGMLIRRDNQPIQNEKHCPNCGGDVTGRNDQAEYCSEECRIEDKNWRRDQRLPLVRLSRQLQTTPSLFDTIQYIQLNIAQQMIAKKYNIRFE